MTYYDPNQAKWVKRREWTNPLYIMSSQTEPLIAGDSDTAIVAQIFAITDQVQRATHGAFEFSGEINSEIELEREDERHELEDPYIKEAEKRLRDYLTDNDYYDPADLDADSYEHYDDGSIYHGVDAEGTVWDHGVNAAYLGDIMDTDEDAQDVLDEIVALL